MIMVLSGTKDGRALIASLLNSGYSVLATTTTSYGGSLIKKDENCLITTQRLNLDKMKNLILDKKIKLVIDATHPYAVEVSQNAMQACNITGIPYFRYHREESKLGPYESFIRYVSSYEKAVDYLMNVKGNILLTIGSKMLEIFAHKLDVEKLFPRVLPTSEVIKKCEDLGFRPSNIIAMQGPFSLEMNIEMIRKYKIAILVSKESGDAGGTIEKLEAAQRMNIPVLMIQRPAVAYYNVYNNMEQLVNKVREVYV